MLYYGYMEYVPKLFGAIGLLIITYGIFEKRELRRDVLFALGGLGLLIYSISLMDPIFIPLQIVFIGASLYEIIVIKRRRT